MQEQISLEAQQQERGLTMTFKIVNPYITAAIRVYSLEEAREKLQKYILIYKHRNLSINDIQPCSEEEYNEICSKVKLLKNNN